MYNKFFYDLLWCNIFQTFTTIELTITPVEDYMNNINTVTPYLQVVSALIQADFTCSVVSLKKTGRFLHHSSCPFTSKDFKILFMYLQQFLLQVGSSKLKDSGVNNWEPFLIGLFNQRLDLESWVYWPYYWKLF